MSPLIPIALLAVIWLAAGVLWFADSPDPRAAVDVILDGLPATSDEQLAA